MNEIKPSKEEKGSAIYGVYIIDEKEKLSLSEQIEAMKLIGSPVNAFGFLSKKEGRNVYHGTEYRKVRAKAKELTELGFYSIAVRMDGGLYGIADKLANDSVLEEECKKIVTAIVLISEKQTKTKAIERVQRMLFSAKKEGHTTAIRVLERVLHDFVITSAKTYNELRKQLFSGE